MERERQAGFLAAVAVLALSLLSGAAVQVNAPGDSLTLIPPPSEPVQPGGSPIRLEVEQLLPGEKIQLGEFPMTAGTVCEAQLTWEGGARVTIECRPGASYPLESGKPSTFTIPSDGFYSFPICNRGAETAFSLRGSIRSYQDPDFVPESPASSKNSVTYSSFELAELEGGAAQSGPSYYLEAGEGLRLIARVESGTVTARLLPKEGSAAVQSCRLSGRGTWELRAPEAGEYRLELSNDGEEAARDAMGLVLRIQTT